MESTEDKATKEQLTQDDIDTEGEIIHCLQECCKLLLQREHIMDS